MKKLLEACLVLAVHTLVISAKRRRVWFMNCPLAKANSDLMTTKPARSRAECSLFCLNEEHCLSASYCKTTEGSTCQLSRFYADGSCSGLVADGTCSRIAIVNPCENAGTFSPGNRTCHCVEGFVGDYCQRRYRDCMETSLQNKIYTIQPFGSRRIFQWACNTPSSNYTLITYFLFTIHVNHRHPWRDMERGIVPSIPVSGYFFIGLENVHLLTEQGKYDMLVLFWPSGQPYGKVWYRNFRVKSKSEGYAWSWDSFEADIDRFPDSYVYLDGFGGVGDITTNLNGQRFGTFDNDVNGCAKNASWWYNPNGCTVLRFEENGISWPTNRSGTVNIEYIDRIFIGITPVYWFVNDDLVLE